MHKKTQQELENEAQAVGLSFVGPYQGSLARTGYLCNVHGSLEMIPGNVQRGKGCRFCNRIGPSLKTRPTPPRRREARVSLEALQDRARAVGLVYADEYKRSHELARYTCQEHGEVMMVPHSVRLGRGCRFCSGNVVKDETVLQDEAQSVGLLFVGPYLGDGKPTAYRCLTHGETQKRPGDVKAGKGCRHCAKYGPDMVAPTTFYVWRVERIGDPSFIGYGITKDKETRYAAHRATFRTAGAQAELIAEVECKTGREAADLETRILKTLRDYQVETLLRGFKTEAVSISQESTVLSLLRESVTIPNGPMGDRSN